MKAVNFAVTMMKRNQVINLILNYHYLFPHLKNKIGTKKVAKSKTAKLTPIPPKPAPRKSKLIPKPAPRKRKIPFPPMNIPSDVPEYVLRDLGIIN